MEKAYGAFQTVDYNAIPGEVNDVHTDAHGEGEADGTPRNEEPSTNGAMDAIETEVPADDNTDRGDPARNVDSIDGDNAYFTVEATAYTNGAESTGKRPGDPAYGITASGTTTSEGRTAACPPSLAFGTEIYVKELDNTYICEDRGGAVTEGKIDIYMADLGRAIDFGRQDVEVRVLK